MEIPVIHRSFTVSPIIVVLIVSMMSDGVHGAGECGTTSPNLEAFRLLGPCMSAALDMTTTVSSACCIQAAKLLKNPTCFCAVILSNTAKSSGAKPEIAITIPKRCNIADRPVGYKCGDYTLDAANAMTQPGLLDF